MIFPPNMKIFHDQLLGCSLEFYLVFQNKIYVSLKLYPILSTLLIFNNLVSSLHWWMLQIKLSSVETWMLNFECVIVSPNNNNDAMPLDTTINTICHWDCNTKVNVFHINIFPVPS